MRRSLTHQPVQSDTLSLRRGRLGVLVKLFLSVGLLAFIVRSVDFGVFWATLVAMDVRLFSLSLLLFFPAQLLAAYRWYFLLRHLDLSVSFRSVLRHYIFGQFTALFLPGQISGDIVRAISISRGRQGKALFAFSVMLDKVLLLASIAALALIGGIISRQLSQFTGIIFTSAGILACSLFVTFLFALYRPVSPNIYADKIVQIFPVIIREKFAAIKTIFKAPRLSLLLLGKMFSLAIMLQLVNTLGGFLLILALHLPIGIVDWIAVNAIVSVIQVLPISIGGLGVREGAFGAILSLYGVSLGVSTAFSLTSFIFSILLISCSWIIGDNLLKEEAGNE